MIALIAVLAGLWLLALIVIAAASDTNGAVALALANDEPIVASEQHAPEPSRPAVEHQLLVA